MAISVPGHADHDSELMAITVATGSRSLRGFSGKVIGILGIDF